MAWPKFFSSVRQVQIGAAWNRPRVLLHISQATEYAELHPLVPHFRPEWNSALVSDSCPDWNSRASRKSQMHCASGDSTILYPWAAALPTSALSSVGKKDRKGSMTEGSLTLNIGYHQNPFKHISKLPIWSSLGIPPLLDEPHWIAVSVCHTTGAKSSKREINAACICILKSSWHPDFPKCCHIYLFNCWGTSTFRIFRMHGKHQIVPWSITEVAKVRLSRSKGYKSDPCWASSDCVASDLIAKKNRHYPLVI